MFRKWLVRFQQANCAHYYHNVREGEACDMYGCYDVVTLYCHKCDYEKTVREGVAKKTLRAQKIKTQWNRSER